MRSSRLKLVVEKCEDGYSAYVDGVKPDIILGQGDTREEAVSDLLSAVRCYEETFGTRLLD